MKKGDRERGRAGKRARKGGMEGIGTTREGPWRQVEELEREHRNYKGGGGGGGGGGTSLQIS